MTTLSPVLLEPLSHITSSGPSRNSLEDGSGTFRIEHGYGQEDANKMLQHTPRPPYSIS